MEGTMKKNRTVKDRFIWIATTSVLAVILIFFTAIPVVMADTSSAETEHYFRLFQQVFRFIQNNYVEEVDPKTLFDGAMEGMFNSLDDPYSIYLTKTEMQDLSDTTTGKFGGVGLYISKDIRGRSEEYELPYVRVVSPIEGTPGARAGISAGDYIMEIEGESTEEMDIDGVVELLRGPPGTEVKVTILRGKDIVFPVTLKRAIIEVPTTRRAMIPGGIGYIRIIQFTPLTDDSVREDLEYLRTEGYQALVIDVRNNPGGLLTAVVDTADYFLSGGTVVSTKSRVPGENHEYTAGLGLEVPLDMPIVVLVNEGSASAAEILAGALKDRDRAHLIGQTTYGKGSVQQVQYFGEGGFKLTMSRYYTPSGVNIDKIGIEPDQVVEEEEFTDEENEDYKKLIEENRIPQWVENNPDPNQSQVQRFVDALQKEGFDLTDRLLKRLVRLELNRTKNNPPVYDLEYDLALQKAVDYLKSKDL